MYNLQNILDKLELCHIIHYYVFKYKCKSTGSYFTCLVYLWWQLKSYKIDIKFSNTLDQTLDTVFNVNYCFTYRLLITRSAKIFYGYNIPILSNATWPNYGETVSFSLLISITVC